MQPNSPQLIADIPPWQASEGLPMKVLNLQDFIQVTEGARGNLRFSATLSDGSPLPAGVVCTQAGEFTGVPRVGTFRQAPYSVLVIARNESEIPCIAYFDLFIQESQRAKPKEPPVLLDETQQGVPNLDEQLQEFLAIIDPDSQQMLAEVAPGLTDFSDTPQAREQFVFYMVQKYAPMQLHDATQMDGFADPIINVTKAKTGWPIFYNGKTLTTVNPNAVSTTFSREALILTMREMIEVAQTKGWKRLGVSGADPELGALLIEERNLKEYQQQAEDPWIFEVDSIHNPATIEEIQSVFHDVLSKI